MDDQDTLDMLETSDQGRATDWFDVTRAWFDESLPEPAE